MNSRTPSWAQSRRRSGTSPLPSPSRWHQLTDISGTSRMTTTDLSAGTFLQLRGTSDQRIQCGGNHLRLRRDVVNEQNHPGSQRFGRGQSSGQLPLCRRQLRHLAVIDPFEQRVACRKVPVQRSRSHCLATSSSFATSKMRSRFFARRSAAWPGKFAKLRRHKKRSNRRKPPAI